HRRAERALHGLRIQHPIFHHGNTQSTLSSVTFRNIDALKRLRLIAPRLELVYCHCFLLWCLPDNAIYSGCFLAIIGCHSLNGQASAAERAGEQTLQDFHLIPSARLCRLDDTRLEAAPGLIGFRPIDALPVNRFVGECTSSCCHCCHLLFLRFRYHRFSRQERPDGSLPACAWNDIAAIGSLPISPITRHPSLSSSSF